MIKFPKIILLSSIIGCVYSARILCFYTVPFYSHQSVFHVLTRELSRRGHELVVIAAGEQTEKNITSINTNSISEAIWYEGYTPNLNLFFEPNKTTDTMPVLYLSLNTLYKNIHEILTMTEVKALIQDKNKKFDLLLIEECVPANIIIAARFNAPVIYVSSYYSNHMGLQATGSEINPIYYSDNNFGHILWNASVWEKLSALIYSIRLNIMYWYFEGSTNELIVKHFGENAPTFRDLRNNVELMVLNTYQFWDFSRPVPPSVVYNGGLHLQAPKPLPEDLKSYLDNATNGVIYMSFGSKLMCSDLHEETLDTIIRVFASLPYKVIWKMDGELPGEHDNIRLESWVPQNDLLHHPSVKVFITHAGLQSTDEAIAAGVPLIAFPLYVDQFSNANNYVLYDIGVKLNIKTLIEQQFREAIVDVAENKRYRNNIKRLESIMKQHRDISLNKTMHYIDYVLKHGNTNLHSPAANLFEEYYHFDVIFPVIVLLLVSLIIIFQFLMRLFYTAINMLKNSIGKYNNYRASLQ